VKRNAILIDQNTHEGTKIMVDVDNAETILPYVMTDKIDKEFKEIRHILKENLRNKDKYKKIDVSDKAKDVFEMRFIKNDRNDRIYCKEINISKTRYIVMVELYKGKKSQQIEKTEKRRIESIGGYEYEFKS
jgi:hypothetical protein